MLLFSNELDTLDIKFQNLSPEKAIDTLNSLGKAAYRKQEFLISKIYFSKALELATANNNILQQAKINNNIGIIEDTKGNYPDALEHYRKSLNYYEQQSNKNGIEKVLNNIGIVYEELNMYEKSLEYFKSSLAIKIKSKNPDKLSLAGTYNNIAIIYENYLHQSDSALIYYQMALDNYSLTGNNNGKGRVCSNIGLLYFRKNNIKVADSCFKEALKVFNANRNKSGIASVLFYKAKLEIKKGRYNKAVTYLRQAMILSRRLHLKDLQKDIHKAFSETYEKQGNTDSALYYYKKFHELNDDLLNSQKLNKIKSLEQKIEIDHKDYEINLLKKDNEINRLLQNRQLILIFALLLIIVSIVIIFYQFWRKRKIKNEMELSRARTRLLRTQMSPHFLFNSLMSIQTFLIEGDVKGASKYLTMLARLMRLILTYSRESYISVEQEIEIINFYLAIEKLRFGDKIEYIIKIDPAIDKPNTLIPPLMIQPALENAIVHGLMPCKKNGNLSVTFKKTNTNIVVFIEDDGIGYKSANNSSLHNKKSFSTDIINERISLIEKQFGQKIIYNIEEIIDNRVDCPGTRVTFKFPLDY
jgi:tetratricopeptide (TPR) repeat protein